MSSVYLIRHGQAGTRDNYDVLSETGRAQARLLGEYFQAAGIRFHAAYSGGMRRQHETAEAVLGVGGPEITIDPRWNEFSLDGLWKDLAPAMLAADPQFARDYAALHAGNPALDRVMTVCDVQLIRAWVANHHEVQGVEPWADFRARVESARAGLVHHGPGENIAVFTSATPTAIWCGGALGADERRIFRIAGVLFNSSFSTLRLREDEVTLFSLNNTPHLADGPMRTFR